jgi:ketosteroid isomerase-like protein
VIDLGDDRILVLVHEAGRGRESGVAVDAPMAMLLTFRRGRVISHREFPDRQQALSEVGLAE